MSRSTPLLIERNNKIFSRYKELYTSQFLRHTRILELLSQEFYLGELTIEKIVLSNKKNK